MKKLMIVVMMMVAGVANAFHVDPVTKEALGHTANPATPAVMALALGTAVYISQKQGVLACHSKPNVKVSNGSFSYSVTDCEANGFK